MFVTEIAALQSLNAHAFDVPQRLSNTEHDSSAPGEVAFAPGATSVNAKV
jgi:hypothetical protein